MLCVYMYAMCIYGFSFIYIHSIPYHILIYIHLTPHLYTPTLLVPTYLPIYLYTYLHTPPDDGQEARGAQEGNGAAILQVS